MNSTTNVLLGGVALCALATVPAVARNVPGFHITALYGDYLVNKTKLRNPNRQHLTVTDSVSSYVPASDLNTKVHLHDTFTKWSSMTASSWECGNPKQKIKVDPKKTQYAKIGTATETYSLGCTDGASVFYGDTYKLTNSAGEGQTDHFVSTLYGWFQRSGVKYKGTLYLDVSVHIGK